MPTLPPPTRTLILLLAANALPAQAPVQTQTRPTPAVTAPPRKPAPLPFNLNLIFLDPAHGGSDPGAPLPGDISEKDATLAFAKLLRTLLIPLNFTVVLTHESAAVPTQPPPPQPLEDGTVPPTPPFNPAANNPTSDTRVEAANRSHAVACLLIHASNGGHGIHLYTSSLAPAPQPDPDPALHALTPWDAAQAPLLAQSTILASDLATALNGIRLPLVVAHASVRPIDSMTCPAVALELSPLGNGDAQTSPADPAYQQRVAAAIAAALDTWRTHAQSQAIAAQAAAQAARDAASPAQPVTPRPKPKPQPKSQPKPIPQESPLTLTPDPPRTPAPVIRRPPTAPPPPGNAP